MLGCAEIPLSATGTPRRSQLQHSNHVPTADAPVPCTPVASRHPSGSYFQKPGFNLSLPLDFDGAALLE